MLDIQIPLCRIGVPRSAWHPNTVYNLIATIHLTLLSVLKGFVDYIPFRTYGKATARTAQSPNHGPGKHARGHCFFCDVILLPHPVQERGGHGNLPSQESTGMIPKAQKCLAGFCATQDKQTQSVDQRDEGSTSSKLMETPKQVRPHVR